MKRGSDLNRSLDRYVGIPLVFSAGLICKGGRRPERPLRIGIFSATALGDALLLAGIIKDIKTQHPQSNLVMVCGKSNKAAAELLRLAGIDDVISVPITNPAKAIQQLRAESRLDILMDFAPWSRLPALYSASCLARWTVGFRTPGQFRHYAYDAVAEHSNKIHEVENYRNVAVAAGFETHSEPFLDPGPAIRPQVEQDYSRLIIFHPWASGGLSHLREWPLERWIKLAKSMNDPGTLFLITGGPGDLTRMQFFSEQFKKSGLEAESLTGTRGLLDVARVLKGADLVVSVNTGIMHLAAILGVQTVSLNGPTSDKRWGPRGPKAISINPSCSGCGYLNFGFEFAGNRTDCMEYITPEQVLQHIHRHFGKV